MGVRQFNIDNLISFIDRFGGQRRNWCLLIAGLFSALSFAPIYFFPALILTLPLLLIIAHKSENGVRAFLSGYVFGFGHFFAGLYWIGNSFAAEPSLPHWAGFIMVAVLAAYLSVFIALASYGIWYFHHRQTLKENLLHIVVSFVTLWVICEWLRGAMFTRVSLEFKRICIWVLRCDDAINIHMGHIWIGNYCSVFNVCSIPRTRS